MVCFFLQAEDGIRDVAVTGVQTCALPISGRGTDILLGGNAEFMAKQESFKKGLMRPVQPVAGEITAKASADRKSVVEGKSVDLGGRRIIKKKKTKDYITIHTMASLFNLYC